MAPQKPTNAVVDQVCKAWPRGVGGGALAKDGTGSRSGALQAEKNNVKMSILSIGSVSPQIRSD